MKKAERIIVWFRKDLRLHDNEALTLAMKHSEEIVPVYVFNTEELMGDTSYGFQKTGPHRAQFLLESVEHLRQSFQKRGIDLIIRHGKAEEEIFELVKETEASHVYANMERTQEEVEVQNSLERNLWSIGLEISFFRGKMLYYTQDLPFPISHTPDTFSSFRKEVERFVPIREPLSTPTTFKPWTIEIRAGVVPTLEELGHSSVEQDSRAEVIFKGGEAAALRQATTYFGANHHFDHFNETRYELVGAYRSSHFSPWLAAGCLSPKYVYAELMTYQKEHRCKKAVQSFFQELLWRDYYRLMGKKYGDAIFENGGIRGQENKNLTKDRTVFDAWRNGETASPLINACMLQLRHTGFISQKGRQLVSSYLVNDLKIHWRMGAAYFQHILIDYDICSNWVNWNIVGGVGPDPKEDRFVNVENQAKRFDSKGEYIRRWSDSVLNE
ncbi:MAG: DASH family cryptochrome [Aureispira sp.]